MISASLARTVGVVSEFLLKHRQLVLGVVLLVVVIVAGIAASGHGNADGNRITGPKPANGLATTPHERACPASDRQLVAKSQSANRPQDQQTGALLVPRAPSSLLICRYNGLKNPAPISVPGKPPFGLVASAHVTDQTKLTQFVQALNQIPVRNGSGPISCPADFDRDLVLYFGYGSGKPDYVYTVDIDGCQQITSGTVSRLALDAAVVGQLKALVPTQT